MILHLDCNANQRSFGKSSSRCGTSPEVIRLRIVVVFIHLSLFTLPSKGLRSPANSFVMRYREAYACLTNTMVMVFLLWRMLPLSQLVVVTGLYRIHPRAAINRILTSYVHHIFIVSQVFRCFFSARD